MNTRRQFLRSITASFVILKAGLLFPIKALAEWPEKAFLKESPDSALTELFGDRPIKKTDKIIIEMPPGAENGAIVPVTVKIDLDNVQSITLLAEKNPVSLLAQFFFHEKGKGDFLKTRIKLAKSSNVIVVVEADGMLCSAEKYIEVLKGGCD